MAFKLEKQKTGSTPYILIDEERGYMAFEGESFHENVANFYAEIDEWLRGYLDTPFENFTFDCKLEYINSSTAKLLLNMLTEMDEHTGGGKHVTVNWIMVEGNDIMIECGEDFRDEMNNLEFNLIVK